MAFAFANACNDPDQILEVVSGQSNDASIANGGGSTAQPMFPNSTNPGCNVDEQRRLDRVLGAIGSLATDCELPLTYDLDDGWRRPLPASGARNGSKLLFCEADQRRLWVEPPPPLPPQKFVYCSESCRAVLQFYQCLARHNACRTASIEDDDAGAACL